MFLGKSVGSSMNAWFTAYQPMGYREKEQPGMNSWNGPPLDYVPITSGQVYSHPDLDMKVQKLIESTWKFAQPKEGAVRGNVTMGGHRSPPVSRGPGMRGGNLMGGHRTPPKVDAFRSAAPVAFGSQLQGLASHLKNVVPEDWKLMKDIPRVSAYTFRGDGRKPEDIKKAGGFFPPITRTDDHYVRNCIYPTFAAYIKTKLNVDLSFQDFERLLKNNMPTEIDRQNFAYYSMWRSQVERESMHIGRMVAKEDLKGYVSTTKATQVAKGFAGSGGYVYLTLVESGFHIPSKGKHTWTSIFGEEEIASPAPIKWQNVMGYRQLGNDKKFTGPIYFLSGLNHTDNKAFETCYRLFSGIPQPM